MRLFFRKLLLLTRISVWFVVFGVVSGIRVVYLWFVLDGAWLKTRMKSRPWARKISICWWSFGWWALAVIEHTWDWIHHPNTYEDCGASGSSSEPRRTSGSKHPRLRRLIWMSWSRERLLWTMRHLCAAGDKSLSRKCDSPCYTMLWRSIWILYWNFMRCLPESLGVSLMSFF